MEARVPLSFGNVRRDTSLSELPTDRLRLRRSVPEDAQAISGYRSDASVHARQGWRDTSPEYVRQSIVQMERAGPGDRGSWVQFTVFELDGGRLVGDVGLHPPDDEEGVVEIGYTIAPECQGRGYATEAVRALVAYSLDVLGARLVRAWADEDNAASIRVAEKAGLRVVERIEEPYEDGVWHGVKMELERRDHRHLPGG